MKNIKKIINGTPFKICLALFVMLAAAFCYRKFIFIPGVKKDLLAQKVDVIVPTDGTASHPKLLMFSNKWKGYKYWMVVSTYSKNNKNEDPVVNVSNDLKTWVFPDGLSGTLDSNPDSNKVYNSDPYIAYNKLKDRVEVFWRQVNENLKRTVIYMSYTTDGVKWSDKELIINSSNNKEYDYVSPAFMISNGNYKIWYVDKKKIWYVSVNDGVKSKNQAINVKFDKGVTPYHLDVTYNEKTKTYVLLIAAYKGDKNNMSLYTSSSTDNTKWTEPKLVMKPNKYGWYKDGLHRSSISYYKDRYYVMYSGHTGSKYGLGFVYGTSLDNLKPYEI